MVRSFVLLILMFLGLSAWAQSASEEAIILNQELQFLEDSISNATAAPARTETDMSPSVTGEVKEERLDLERTYFNDSADDSIRTRTAAPRRRSF